MEAGVPASIYFHPPDAIHSHAKAINAVDKTRQTPKITVLPQYDFNIPFVGAV
jgi:hypothetical protein